jgi:purine-nucleoside/S-methyl-5'-thioadenosine phosphorylase / adenosine deaminase
VQQQIGGLPLYRFTLLPDDRFAHAISGRQGGVSEPPYDTLNLARLVQDDPTHVSENRTRFAKALGTAPDRFIDSRQVHADQVLVVDAGYRAGDAVPDADVQITDQPGWLLNLRFADCVPILLADPRRGAVAVIHAGWRGTRMRAATTAVRALAERYGCVPRDLLAGIGPSIGPCCYEVGEEVASQFSDLPFGVLRGFHARPHLDLWALNRAALETAGLPPERIELAAICTRCHQDLFFSHRAMGYPAGRFGAAIGLR